MSAVLHAEPQCNPLGGGATTVDWDRLAGGLVLSPGGAGQSITRLRPLRLNRLLHGQAADQLPGLLAAIFALCGHAHRHTARLAIAAARGFKATPGAQDMMALRAQTAREHVRRILMEWPLPAAADRAAAAKALSSCPLLCESDMAASLQHLPRWLERYVLAMPPQEWLRELGKGGGRWLCSKSSLARWPLMTPTRTLSRASLCWSIKDETLAPGRASATATAYGMTMPGCAWPAVLMILCA